MKYITYNEEGHVITIYYNPLSSQEVENGMYIETISEPEAREGFSSSAIKHKQSIIYAQGLSPVGPLERLCHRGIKIGDKLKNLLLQIQRIFETVAF